MKKISAKIIYSSQIRLVFSKFLQSVRRIYADPLHLASPLTIIGVANIYIHNDFRQFHGALFGRMIFPGFLAASMSLAIEDATANGFIGFVMGSGSTVSCLRGLRGCEQGLRRDYRQKHETSQRDTFTRNYTVFL